MGKEDFRILKVVGRGSYGTVFLVEKLEGEELEEELISSFVLTKGTGKYYAMKVMKKETLK